MSRQSEGRHAKEALQGPELRGLQALISAPVTRKASLSSLELEYPYEMAAGQPFRV